MSYDSSKDTLSHIRRVNELVLEGSKILIDKAIRHDSSKLCEPEKQGFDTVSFKLSNLKYGSEEYKTALQELKPILNHHYAANDHHPEHFQLSKCPTCNKVAKTADICPKCSNSQFGNPENNHLSIDGMDLFDVIEMLCDWKAATERMKDGSLSKSLEINSKRFNISPQMLSILENTAKKLNILT